jgi:hypothetical protein
VVPCYGQNSEESGALRERWHRDEGAAAAAAAAAARALSLVQRRLSLAPGRSPQNEEHINSQNTMSTITASSSSSSSSDDDDDPLLSPRERGGGGGRGTSHPHSSSPPPRRPHVAEFVDLTMPSVSQDGGDGGDGVGVAPVEEKEDEEEDSRDKGDDDEGAAPAARSAPSPSPERGGTRGGEEEDEPPSPSPPPPIAERLEAVHRGLAFALRRRQHQKQQDAANGAAAATTTTNPCCPVILGLLSTLESLAHEAQGHPPPAVAAQAYRLKQRSLANDEAAGRAREAARFAAVKADEARAAREQAVRAQVRAQGLLREAMRQANEVRDEAMRMFGVGDQGEEKAASADAPQRRPSRKRRIEGGGAAADRGLLGDEYAYDDENDLAWFDDDGTPPNHKRPAVSARDGDEDDAAGNGTDGSFSSSGEGSSSSSSSLNSGNRDRQQRDDNGDEDDDDGSNDPHYRRRPHSRRNLYSPALPPRVEDETDPESAARRLSLSPKSVRDLTRDEFEVAFERRCDLVGAAVEEEVRRGGSSRASSPPLFSTIARRRATLFHYVCIDRNARAWLAHINRSRSGFPGLYGGRWASEAAAAAAVDENVPRILAEVGPPKDHLQHPRAEANGGLLGVYRRVEATGLYLVDPGSAEASRVRLPEGVSRSLAEALRPIEQLVGRYWSSGGGGGGGGGGLLARRVPAIFRPSAPPPRRATTKAPPRPPPPPPPPPTRKPAPPQQQQRPQQPPPPPPLPPYGPDRVAALVQRRRSHVSAVKAPQQGASSAFRHVFFSVRRKNQTLLWFAEVKQPGAGRLLSKAYEREEEAARAVDKTVRRHCGTATAPNADLLKKLSALKRCGYYRRGPGQTPLPPGVSEVEAEALRPCV